ncbi:MAG: endonuclease/exonuclease/phosphatase family protein [Pseudomonadota bacterium]
MRTYIREHGGNLKSSLAGFLIMVSCLVPVHLIAGNASNLRIATFNVSIEATNYLDRNEIAKDPSRSVIVQQLLDQGDHPQIKNIAKIIQMVRPDVLLLNEFDYVPQPDQRINAFIENYLNKPSGSEQAINYPYRFVAPVNTGIPSPFDLDNDGKALGQGGDAFGFGYYPGQYGMVLLSRFPIDSEGIRTFQKFLWKDMPNALIPKNEDGSPWYSMQEWAEFRLSSKSHWDIPINTPDGVVHVIAAHPTPPTFDGTEDRNGKRNHDEIRLISDYLSNANYLYDDAGGMGGLPASSSFVVLGDLNSSPHEGDSIQGAIKELLDHPLANASCEPSSIGGKAQRPDNTYSASHTAAWGLRVDYVLPSKHGLRVNDCGVFWPSPTDAASTLVDSREASSDHRLVWVDLQLGP